MTDEYRPPRLRDVLAKWPNNELRWVWLRLYLKGQFQAAAALAPKLIERLLAAACWLAFLYLSGAAFMAGALSTGSRYVLRIAIEGRP